MRPTINPAVVDRTRHVAGAILILAALVGMFLSPLSGRLALTYVSIGVVSGAIWFLNDEILNWVGVVVFVFGAEYAAHQTPITVPWWEPTIVVAGALVASYFLCWAVRQNWIRRRNPLTGPD